jgi:prepilin-type N-terminal cleavage/methylation domain-containing protein
MHTTHHAHRGFSLIELLFVIAIIGFLASIIIASLYVLFQTILVM